MELSELIIQLRLEYDDSVVPYSLSAEQLNRAVKSAAAVVNKDLDRAFILTASSISPDPDPDEQEILLTRALVTVCGMMAAKTAKNFSFSSGDKKIDKSKQSSYWTKLAKDKLDWYRQLVSERNPEYGDASLILKPLIYEIGSDS